MNQPRPGDITIAIAGRNLLIGRVLASRFGFAWEYVKVTASLEEAVRDAQAMAGPAGIWFHEAWGTYLPLSIQRLGPQRQLRMGPGSRRGKTPAA